MSEDGSRGPLGLFRSAPKLAVCGTFFELSPMEAGSWVSWTGMG